MSAVLDYPLTHQGVRNLDQPRSRRRSQWKNVGPSERVLSTIAGAGLGFLGLRQGGLLGNLLAIGGGMVIYRGITGHCQAYSAAGINTNR